MKDDEQARACRTTRSYHNPWIPAEALRILEAEKGAILDVGGGAAPYYRASHILDSQSFDEARLLANEWGRAEDRGPRAEDAAAKKIGERTLNAQRSTLNLSVSSNEHPASSITHQASSYTQLDLCSWQKWPFDDKHFDLGLCSHCLEDLRDPLPAVREISRVCRRVLIIVPSRLLEQTMGIDHPRYCGFYHHPWIVFQEDGKLIFRRKTAIVNLPGCHVVCPFGKTLSVHDGAAYFIGAGFETEERVFWSERDDFEDCRKFIEPYLGNRDIFVDTPERRGLRQVVWHLRRRYLGAV